MNTVLYVRSSTDLQKHSIEMQKTMGLKKAYENNTAFYKIYEDKDVSATLLNVFERPALSQMLEGIYKREISTLYVYKRDRLARNVEQYLKIYEILKEYNINVIFTAENEPPMLYSPVHQFIELIYAGVAENESIQIKKRIKASKNTKILNNEHPGGAVPYGYLLVKSKMGKDKSEKSNLMIDELKKEEINRLFTEISETNCPTIYEFLEQYKYELDPKLTATKIRNLISNVRYKGYVALYDDYDVDIADVNKNEDITNIIDPRDENFSKQYVFSRSQQIVSEILWHKANEKIDSLYRKNVNKTKHAYSYLEGIVKCKTCFLNKEEKQKQKHYNMLAHTYNDDSRVFIKCNKHTSNLQYVDELSDVILRAITRFIDNKYKSNYITFFKQAISQQLNEIKLSIAKMESKLHRIEEQIDRSVVDYLYMNDSLNSVMFQREIIQLGTSKMENITQLNKAYNIQNQLNELINDVNPSFIEHNSAEGIINFIRSKPDSTIHSLLKNMIDYCLVDNREIEIYLNEPYVELVDDSVMSS